LIERVAIEFAEEIRQKLGAQFGAYEPAVPGQGDIIEVELE
jgi:hypothetical protein